MNLDENVGEIVEGCGGSFGLGTVFKLSPQDGSFELPPESTGSYTETILHSFEGKADGCTITSGVVLDSSGNLYGTASQCGDHKDGTVYRLERSGSKYRFKVILTFDGTNGEYNGKYPYDSTGHLALDSAGNVYGTSSEGGANGDGTVFKLAAGSFLYTDLHDFNDNGTDGYDPIGGVSLDSLGNFYGTLGGGSNLAIRCNRRNQAIALRTLSPLILIESHIWSPLSWTSRRASLHRHQG
jgi:uncharacterized repeat protein (TIGR03803 family)